MNPYSDISEWFQEADDILEDAYRWGGLDVGPRNPYWPFEYWPPRR